MTQPTGDHASGVKLASAYVDVAAHTKDGGQEVHQMLQGVEDHSKVVGENSAQNIVTAMKNAGPQASTALGTGMASETAAITKAASSHADNYMKTFKDAVHNSRMSEDIEYLLGKNDDLIKSYGGVHGESYMQRFLQVIAGHSADAKAAGSVAAESMGAGAIESLDRGGLKDYISRMQTWKIDAQRSVMDMGQAYAQMSSAGTYSLEQLKTKHEELATAQAKVKEGTLNIADAQNRLRSIGRDVEQVGMTAAVGENFKKASEGVAGLGSHLGEAGEQAGGLGEKLGGLAAPLAVLASPEVLGVGAVLGVVGALTETIVKVNELGTQWEELGHTIEIQTGATGDRLEALKGQVGDVYKGVTNSMGDVANIVGAVNTVFKDTGKGAEDVTKQIANLSAMTGNVDADTLGTAFRGFNIGGDAAQQQSVIDGLLKTSQDTRTPVNELISSVQRIAPTMDAAHMSMKDTLAMFDEFGQAGIKPEQTFYLMNKAAADATKTGKDFHTVLTDTISAIKNAPSEAEAENIAKGVFGASSSRGGASVATQAIRSGNFDLSPEALAGIENWDGLVNKTRQDTMTWHDEWTLFTHNMAVALQPVSEELHAKVQGALDGVVAWFSSHQDTIVHFATTVVDGFERGATAIGHLVQEALPSIHQALDYMRPAFEGMMPYVQRLASSFGPFASALGRDVVPVVKLLGEVLVWSLTEGMKYAPPMLDFMMHLVNAATDVANWLHKAFGPALSDNMKTVQQDINTAKQYYEDVVTVVEKIEPAIKKWLDSGKSDFDAMKNDLHPVWQLFDDIVTSIEKITNGLNNIHVPDWLSHMGNVLNPFNHPAPGMAGTPPATGQTGLALPGFGGGDIVPAWLEPGEHVLTKEEVAAAGGHENVYMLRSIIASGMLGEMFGGAEGYDTGGSVGGANYRDWYAQNRSDRPWGMGTSEWADTPPALKAFAVAHPLQSPYGGPRPEGKPEGPEKEPVSLPERATQVGDLADKGEKGAKYFKTASGWARDLGKLGKFGENFGALGELAEPVEKAFGFIAGPAAALGGLNWALNAIGNVTGKVNQPTNLSPSERVQQMWFQFHDAPKQYAAHGHQHGPWDQWRPGYMGTTPQGIHIPGTDLSIFGGPNNTGIVNPLSRRDWSAGSDTVLPGAPGAAKKPGDIATPGDGSGFPPGMVIPRRATGGAIHPAGLHQRRERSWVADRFRLATPPKAGATHFQGGGEVGSWGGLDDVKALLSAESGRTPYNFGGYSPRGIDCSGLVAQAVEVYLGLPVSGGHPMSTGDEAGWLAAHGFTEGMGPEGSFRVGFYNGGPGGGHTALTLPDGTNAESGGSGGGVRLGGGAAGATSSEFTQHWYLPAREVVSPSGYSGSSGGGSSGGGSTGGSSGASGGFGGGSAGGGGNYGGAGGGSGLWDSVAQAESSGNWSNRDTGHNGHYGGLQFSPETWAAYGGQGNPADASREQQIEVANRVAFTGYNGQGPQGLQAWETITKGMVPGVTTSTPAGAFGGTSLGDGGMFDPKHSESLVKSQDRVTAATNRLHEAQAKLDADQANPKKKPEEIAKDHDKVTEAQNKLAEATQHLQDVQNAPEKMPKPPGGSARSSQSGSSKYGVGDLFGIGYKGLEEQLPQGFSDPLQWGVTKSASALFKFFGSMLGGDGKGAYDSMVGSGSGGYGGGGSGQVSPYVQNLIAQVPGYSPQQQQSGGGDNIYNHNVNYNGDVNGNPSADPSGAAVRQLLGMLRLGG